MKTIILCFILTVSLFSQGMYLSKENGFSLGFMYGADKDIKELSFAAVYSLSGYVDFSYSRSKYLDEKNTDNFQNEFFLRGYILKDKLPVFLSGAFGYIYQKAETNLWNNYPITATNKGIAYEIGLHLSDNRSQVSNKIVASFIYRYFDSKEKIQYTTASVVDNNILRSMAFEIALIYNFSFIGVVVGPRFTTYNNFDDMLYGFNLTLILKH